MKPLRGVIFDYGNTLVRLDLGVGSLVTDYGALIAPRGVLRLWSFLNAKRPLPESAFTEQFLDIRARNRERAEAACEEIPMIESVRQTLRAIGEPDRDEQTLRDAVAEFFETELELVRPVPGAREAIEALRERGLCIAMLSNATSGAYVASAVGRLGWSGIFDPLVVSADLGLRKPRAETFRAVLERWPFEPDEVAMVGDSLYHDVKGAQELGLRTVHFNLIPNPFDEPYVERIRPTIALSSHSDLVRALLSG